MDTYSPVHLSKQRETGGEVLDDGDIRIFGIGTRACRLHNRAGGRENVSHDFGRPVRRADVIRVNVQDRHQLYEPFSGSGTTFIAAQSCQRVCHAMELDPAYVDVAVLRWQAFTEQVATIEGAGMTFDEVARERGRRGEANSHAREIGMGGIRGVPPTKHGKLPRPYATNPGPEVS
ncbi:site-specific DNA-methyltransferase [Arenibacterium halophilum]|uniref:site-specific DNA-methyltransferase n=1 Tax=Arenibacterium halophilum TaxID=2583821 RepID=UPI001AEDC107